MKLVLLIDFGSTFTKVTAVDVDSATLLGAASAYTTVHTDIGEGLEQAMERLRERTGPLEFEERYACSSAAGGLRMIASGLVPELTAEAARQASLGAGAKVLKSYSFELTDEDIEEIEELSPDIFMLTGGTDGGNSECILHNAKMLAGCGKSFPIVIAGNRSAGKKCAGILAGREVYRCDNVMPTLGQLNIEPAQTRIREVFLSRIIHAKGLSKASELVSGIMMPTPSAMLAAMKLLADGYGEEPGIGELVGIDLGGATTDIYSIAKGLPEQSNTVLKGLEEPYAKRTVEGDIGMRYSIWGILEAAGLRQIAALSGLREERVEELARELVVNTDRLPDTDEIKAIDFALAAAAVHTATARHAGTLEQVFTPMGEAYMQTGKDLRRVGQMIVTGGSLIHTDRAAEIAVHAFYSAAQPMSLRPVAPRILIDRSYILPAMGLLGERYPTTAIRLMKQYLTS